MAKRKPRARYEIRHDVLGPRPAHRPSLYGPKTIRPGILVTKEADTIARAGAASDKISISDAYERAIRNTYGKGRR